MLVGGALVNALAFSGSNYLFTILRSSGVDEERTTKQSNSCRPHRRHGPGNGPSAWTLSTGSSAGKAMPYKPFETSTWQCRICPGHRAQPRPPGARAPAVRLLSPEWRPERPRDCIRDPGDGRDRLCGLPTR